MTVATYRLLRCAVIVLSCVFTSIFSVSGSCQDLSRVMVDLSASNSAIIIDKDTVQKEHLQIVMLELTLGRVGGPKDVNQDFSRRVTEVNGIPSLRLGAYHLLTQSASGSDQAKGFVDNLKQRCVPSQPILLAVDWEKTCFYRRTPASRCEKEGYTEPTYLRDFVNTVHSLTGKFPLIFTGLDTISTYRGAIQSSKDVLHTLTAAPLWIAQYHFDYRLVSGQESGKVFTGYIFPQQSSIAPWRDWAFWQYAGGVAVGPTRRISASLRNQPADLSFFNGTRDEFGRFFNLNAWTCGKTN
jgi:GH25 family lysozyme M1 (1,4-beta-N-acetylmuramidase)